MVVRSSIVIGVDVSVFFRGRGKVAPLLALKLLASQRSIYVEVLRCPNQSLGMKNGSCMSYNLGISEVAPLGECQRKFGYFGVSLSTTTAQPH